MAYSLDLRKKVLEAYLNKEASNQAIAVRFKISVSTVKRIGQRFRKTGTVNLYLDQIGKSTKIDESCQETLKAYLKTNPDATLDTLAKMLDTQHSIDVTPQAIYYVLKKLGITYKKKSIYAIEQDSECVKKKEPTL